MPSTLTGLRVRSAKTADADRILALKQAAFARYLPLTPYRAAASIELLREAITSPNQLARVVIGESGIVGYSMATSLPNGYHLAYIATHADSRSRGAGRELLGDFETVAGELGYGLCRLDVFASNLPARDWYERHGYRNQSSRWTFTLDLASVKGGEFTVRPDTESLRSGLCRELTTGAGQFTAKVGETPVRLGLIARDTVRVLDDGGLGLAELAAAVKIWSPEGRTSILVCGSDAPPDMRLPVRLSERTICMEKKL